MFKLGTKYAGMYECMCVCMYVCDTFKVCMYVCMYVGLEYLDQRFAWFKYLLSVVDTKLSSVLQPQWCAPAHLFNEFSRFLKHVCMYVCMYVCALIYLFICDVLRLPRCMYMCIEIPILKSIHPRNIHVRIHLCIDLCILTY